MSDIVNQNKVKLPVCQTIQAVFHEFRVQSPKLLRLSLPWVVLSTIILAMDHTFRPPQLTPDFKSYLKYSNSLAYSGTLIFFFLSIHVFYLAYTKKLEHPFSSLKWAKCYIRVFFYFVLYIALLAGVIILSVIPFLLATFLFFGSIDTFKVIMLYMSLGWWIVIPILVFFLLIAGVYYIATRLMLYYAGVILEKSRPFSFSWSLLQGNVWPAFLLILFLALFHFAVSLPVIMTASFLEPHAPVWIQIAVLSCGGSIANVLMVLLAALLGATICERLLPPQPAAKKTPAKRSPIKRTPVKRPPAQKKTSPVKPA